MDDFRRWVLLIIMHLVVFVPLKALLYCVEEARFPCLVAGSLFQLGHLRVGIARIHEVSKLLFIFFEALLLSIVEHLQTRVVKPKVIDYVKSNTSVQSRLLYLLSEGQLLNWLRLGLVIFAILCLAHRL